ncbi:hypothetical protein TRFO_10282 [Tritrichomonas foetus]|uniref:Uncharacterized protein n=1 Tax=Tritrichomonas foetus TaxID=1144522 RepID=A0A1J4JB28_9EUKA|nr:hypothetical protein TRFO_10282 [Tritrichomonas foetus]|eukprot:OHS95873.1 hypothetical protein TRFO_10282 [Tritrichomonas foetus]
MHPNYASEGVQVSSDPAAELRALKPVGNIYTSRKDVRSIRQQLQELVPEKEYWTTFASFLHGMCSKKNYDKAINEFLTTDQARALHNELLRAIIFNAHFSRIPPPDVVPKRMPILPKRDDIIIAEKDPKIINIKTYTASDLRRLPSSRELNLRIKDLLSNSKLSGIIADPEAVNRLQFALRGYITAILKKSYDLISPPNSYSERKTATHQDIFYVLKTDKILSSTVSLSVFTKYSTIC